MRLQRDCEEQNNRAIGELQQKIQPHLSPCCFVFHNSLNVPKQVHHATADRATNRVNVTAHLR